MPPYPYNTQIQIAGTSMALHNYIRRMSQNDCAFTQFDEHPNFIPNDVFPDVAIHERHKNCGAS